MAATLHETVLAHQILITPPRTSRVIHAEVSVYPMATKTTSASFYIAKAIESIQGIGGVKYQLNPMGTVLESADMNAIYEAVMRMTDTVHNLGVGRVGVVIKVDSRRDRDTTMRQKIESVKRHMSAPPE